MTNPLRARLTAILNDWITPFLETRGFRLSKNVYERWLETTAWVIDIQQRRWNDNAKAEFTMNCGVFVRGATSIYFDQPDPQPLEIPRCCIHARVGSLAPDRLDKWWQLESHDFSPAVDQSIGEDIIYRLGEHAIPFLSRFGSPEDVLHFLTSPKTKEERFIWPRSNAIGLSYAATIASLLDKSKESHAYIQKALEAAKNAPNEFAVLRVENYLSTPHEDEEKGTP